MTNKMGRAPYLQYDIRRSTHSIPNRMRRRNKGFTLSELQMAIAITVIILVATLSLYISNWRTFLIGNTYIDLYSNSRIALDWMVRDIRWTNALEKTYTDKNSNTYTTSDNSLVLDIPSVDSSGNTINSKYDQVIYQLQGNILYRRVRPNSNTPNPSSRLAEDRKVAKYLENSLKFSSLRLSTNKVETLSNFSATDLDNVTYIAISLPISESMTSLSGGATKSAEIVPTASIKLRNKPG